MRIGNSQGIRIPKPLIEQAGLADDVELRVRDGEIIISRRKAPREDWPDAIREAHTRSGSESPDSKAETEAWTHFPAEFDEEDWEW